MGHMLPLYGFQNNKHMTEIFKPIKGYRNYEVSNVGRIKNIKTGKVLKPSDDKDGYQVVCLSENRKQRILKVHRLVAKAFIPNRKQLPQVNHLDGVKSNNKVNNLEWLTHKDNVQHAINIGLFNNKGEKNPRSKLTAIQVKQIRKKYDSGAYTCRQLSKEYNVDYSNIHYIVNYKSWKD